MEIFSVIQRILKGFPNRGIPNLPYAFLWFPNALFRKNTNLLVSPRLNIGNLQVRPIVWPFSIIKNPNFSLLGLPDDMGEFARFHQLQHLALHFDKPQLLQVSNPERIGSAIVFARLGRALFV